MTSGIFRKLTAREPFVPFTIRTAEGREYRVVHPEMMWLPPGFNTLHLVSDDHLAFVDIPGIVAIVPEEPRR